MSSICCVCFASVDAVSRRCCDCDACTVVFVAYVYAERADGSRVTAMLVWGMEVWLC